MVVVVGKWSLYGGVRWFRFYLSLMAKPSLYFFRIAVYFGGVFKLKLTTTSEERPLAYNEV